MLFLLSICFLLQTFLFSLQNISRSTFSEKKELLKNQNFEFQAQFTFAFSLLSEKSPFLYFLIVEYLTFVSLAHANATCLRLCWRTGSRAH
jgi:hypothetical protein